LRIETGREIVVVPSNGQRLLQPVWRVSRVEDGRLVRVPAREEPTGKSDRMRGRLIDIIV